MTPATSVAFFKSEFGDFLYAPVGAEGNDMPVSVLSTLARLNVDPWKEAAELSKLPRELARQRLASLIERLPKAGWAQTNSDAIAGRLVEYLPQELPAGKQDTLHKGQEIFQLTLSPTAGAVIVATIAILTIFVFAH
jgi:hypothetical protein